MGSYGFRVENGLLEDEGREIRKEVVVIIRVKYY